MCDRMRPRMLHSALSRSALCQWHFSNNSFHSAVVHIAFWSYFALRYIYISIRTKLEAWKIPNKRKKRVATALVRYVCGIACVLCIKMFAFIVVVWHSKFLYIEQEWYCMRYERKRDEIAKESERHKCSPQTHIKNEHNSKRTKSINISHSYGGRVRERGGIRIVYTWFASLSCYRHRDRSIWIIIEWEQMLLR